MSAVAGLHLDPWEADVLRGSLGEKLDGKWAAFEVGVVVSRQNGKDAILEARELAGLYLLDERLLIHSAHQFDTSLEHFRRLLYWIENTSELSRRVKRVSRSHGEEGIELHGPKGRRISGTQRIRFRTRTKSGGRGFTGDYLAFNEAMELPESAIAALLPTLSARPNPQVWYAASAVDQWSHEHGVALARVRERGIAGDSASLAYFEWSAPGDHPDEVSDDTLSDKEAWAIANPALGIRISTDHIANERDSMDPRTFAVERLGIGDWPATDGGQQVIPLDVWEAAALDADGDPTIEDPIALAFDVSPNRGRATIAAAGHRTDGRFGIEVVEHRDGTAWIVDRVAELATEHRAIDVAFDGSGPAAALVPQLEDRGVPVAKISGGEYAQACGAFYDRCDAGQVSHLDTDELNAAVKGASTRAAGDAWAWSRKSSSVDISPLVACTLALWRVDETDLAESIW